MDEVYRPVCEEDCGRNASLECTNCNAHFCDECFAAAHQSTVMKRHQHGPIGKSSKKCSQHSDQRLDMYCVTCQKIVCIKCLFTRQHKNHDSVTIDESAKSKSIELKNLENRLRDKLNRYINIAKEHELAKNILRTVHKDINESIHKRFEDLVNTAIKRRDEMLKESQLVEDVKVKELDHRLFSLQATIEKLKNASLDLSANIEKAVGSPFLTAQIKKDSYVELLKEINKEVILCNLTDGVQNRLVLDTINIKEEIENVGSIIILTNETESVRRDRIASSVCFVFGSNQNDDRDVELDQVQIEHALSQLVSLLRHKMTEKVTEPSKSVFAWGSGNFEGQLSINTMSNCAEPVEVTFFQNKGVIKVVAGLGHGAAITSDGVLYTFGQNTFGELGIGDESDYSQFGKPQMVTALTRRKIISIAASHSCYHTLALADDGTVYSWGKNTFGQLGLGDQRHRRSPCEIVSLSEKNIVNIYAAGYSDDGFSLALSERGEVYAFGQNNYNQLGLGDGQARLVPTLINTLSDVVAVAAGGYHVLALTSNGRVYSWGHNSYGRLGHADFLDKIFPTEIVSLRGKNIVNVVAGGRFSFGTTADAKIYAWGYNGQGELGLGDTMDRTSPQLITMMKDKVKLLKSGYEHTLCLTEGGCLYSFGNNKSGQLGLGDIVNAPRSTPQEIVKFRGMDVVDFACGNNFSFALIR
ncbi:ultraviolet-B receptor UVR8 [Acrasis kona]|uniref:Ultraviolet-B receptor UVR8 n=1 Tax=Acrasis kona TaxID=1008807 RepID=A0AAW2ZF98_9EUKA